MSVCVEDLLCRPRAETSSAIASALARQQSHFNRRGFVAGRAILAGWMAYQMVQCRPAVGGVDRQQFALKGVAPRLQVLWLLR